MSEPVAYMYELASWIDVKSGQYEKWYKYVTFTKPNVPEGSIRNLIALYAKEEITNG